MDYLNLLKYQFIKAKGYPISYLDEKDIKEEFLNWLYTLKKNVNEFSNYAKYLGLDIYNYIELDKGVYDTVDSKTIISPHANTLKKEDSRLFMYQGEPLIISGSNIKKGQVADTYLSHNPYNLDNYSSIFSLCKNGYNICFSVFGNKSDKDIKEKIILFSELKDVGYNLACEDEEFDGNYCLVLYSKTKKLRKGGLIL